MDQMKMEIQQNKIWLSIDETYDVERRSIDDVTVGFLRPDCPGRIFVLNSGESDKVYHSTVCRQFDKAMSISWSGEVEYNNVLLFLSDAAPYEVKAGTVLKNICTKTICVPFCAHG